MKNWKIMGLLSLLIIGLVLVAGCTHTKSNSTSSDELLSSTSQLTYNTVTVTPSLSGSQDLIIGTWRTTDSKIYDDRIQFKVDGTYTERDYGIYSKDSQVYEGGWRANGEYRYTITGALGYKDATDTIIYNPTQKNFYFLSDDPEYHMLFTRYQGNVMGAS